VKNCPKNAPKNAQNAKKERTIGIQKVPTAKKDFGHLQKLPKKEARIFG